MRGFSKPRSRCYDLESMRDSAPGSELMEGKWKEERGWGERREGKRKHDKVSATGMLWPGSICSLGREHCRQLRLGEPPSRCSMSRPLWEQRAAWTGLACPPLQTCSSLGPSERLRNPTLGPFTGPTCLCSSVTLPSPRGLGWHPNCGNYRCKAEHEPACTPGLKSASDCEKEGVGERKQTWGWR